MRRISLIGLLALFSLILVIGQGCVNNGEEQPQATLSVKLVQMVGPTTWVVANGIIPIDLNNINWSWMKEREVTGSIRENSDFVTRFEMDYPIGLPTKDNVTLVIATSSNKIPQLGIITSGYKFIDKGKGTIRDEEVDVYNYEYGQLKEGAHQSIIIGGTTGSLGTSLEDRKIIYVYIKEGVEPVMTGSVEVVISRPRE